MISDWPQLILDLFESYIYSFILQACETTILLDAGV